MLNFNYFDSDRVKKIKNFNEDYSKNIQVEIKTAKVIDVSKEKLKNISGEYIAYETVIKVEDEIITSEEKEIYYKALEKVNQEVEVEIENNTNIDSKKILDIK